MKKSLALIIIALLGIGLVNAPAQFGGAGHGAGSPSFGDATGKLFGEHQTFSATMEFETGDPVSGHAMTMPGRLIFDNGKSRFEMNMAEMKGAAMPPEAVEQMKSMGMDRMVSISRPDKKMTYVIYPGMQSYVENPVLEKNGAKTPDDFKVETTALGREMADGHDCLKNKVVVTDKDGKKHESTVWNAPDMKNFPIKIETTEAGQSAVMHFKDVAFTKPAASAFEVPADLKKYPSMPAMIQEVMMKKMGGMMPPH